MKVTRVGLDIAKQVFQVHGVDERGQARVRKQLARAKGRGEKLDALGYAVAFLGDLPPRN